MAAYLKIYGVMLAAFLALDMVWLGLVARGFYRERLGYLLTETPNWAAAGAFYLLFVAALLVFVVAPGLRGDSVARTVLLGAFFGLVTYATYDLTNLATVRDWPVVVTVVDMIWGTFLSTAVSWAGLVMGRWLR